MEINDRARVHRSELKDISTPLPAKITNIKHLSSYNWIEGNIPTIAVPGHPASWTPRKGSRQVKKDSGLVYIAQNAARHPDSPLEPLFRSVYLLHPEFDIRSVNVVSDRNSIRKLLQFVTAGREERELESFAIQIDCVEDTVILSRTETATTEFIGAKDF